MTRKITDTSKQDPLLNMAYATVPRGIEMQERHGQQDFVRQGDDDKGRTRCQLPTHILHSKREEFEAVGFEFGEPVEGDEIWTDTLMPAGWSKRGSDHAMWSYIHDEKGRQRVAIFYKAAFYDRNCHMSLEGRFTFRKDFIGKDRTQPRICHYRVFRQDGDDAEITEGDLAGHTLIVEVKREVPGEPEGYDPDYYKTIEAVGEEGRAKLAEMYPNYQDPTKHWD